MREREIKRGKVKKREVERKEEREEKWKRVEMKSSFSLD